MALNRRGKKLSEGLEQMANTSGEAWGKALYLGIQEASRRIRDEAARAAVWAFVDGREHFLRDALEAPCEGLERHTAYLTFFASFVVPPEIPAPLPYDGEAPPAAEILPREWKAAEAAAVDGNAAPAVQLCAVEARHQTHRLPPRQSFIR